MIEQSTMWGNVNFTCKCGVKFQQDTKKCMQLHSVDVHHWIAICPVCKTSCKALWYSEK